MLLILSFYNRYESTKGLVSIPETTASTSATTGALVVGGGVGIGGTLNVNNLALETNTISSTNANGAIILSPNADGNVQLNVSANGQVLLTHDPTVPLEAATQTVP